MKTANVKEQQTKFPPGPPPVGKNPIALFKYFRGIRSDTIGWISRRFAKYGDIYYAPMGGSHLYVMRHPDHLREVLIRQASKFKKTEKGLAARQLKRFLGDGLLNSNGEFWRKQRRMIQPAFLRKRLESYALTMTKYAEEMLSQWEGKQQVDISTEMMQLTLRIVNKALFDYDITKKNTAEEVIHQFRSLALSPQILPNWLSPFYQKRIRKAIEMVDDLIYGIIKERKSQGEFGQDLLSILLQVVDEEDNDTMTEKQLRDELLTMYFAGHDTTSHALTWTLYLLSQNDEARKKLQEEVDTVLKGRIPEVADLANLPYVEMVLSESMRIYPPAYAISRTAIEPVEIGEYTLPTGSEVLIWIYITHHDDRWFPDPQKFIPERFSSEEKKQLPQCAYLPFGGGTRICIGKEFALMEAKLILAMIAGRYSLSLVEGHPIVRQLAVTLSPKYGMPMLLGKRETTQL